MLRICFEGFKILMGHFGFFDIAEDMILINSEGEVKVWVNPNLAAMQPLREFTSEKNSSNSRTLNKKTVFKAENTIKLSKNSQKSNSKTKTKSQLSYEEMHMGEHNE